MVELRTSEEVGAKIAKLGFVFMVPIMFRRHMPFPRGFETLKWLGGR